MPVRRYYDPWAAMAQIQDEMNRLFSGVSAGEAENGTVVTADWVPAVDIKEEPERFLLRADIPGVDLAAIEVTMENGILSIKGERPPPTPEERATLKRVERPRGVFYRRFVLPEEVQGEHITARGNNGVIEIVIPKHDRLQSRKIAVEV